MPRLGGVSMKGSLTSKEKARVDDRGGLVLGEEWLGPCCPAHKEWR